MARAAGLTLRLYGSTPLQSVQVSLLPALQASPQGCVCTHVLPRAQVDQWLDYAPYLAAGPGLESACSALNTYLAFRSFLVGYSISIADLACWGQLESE